MLSNSNVYYSVNNQTIFICLLQVIAAEPVQLLMKLRVYLANIWNIWDTCAILFFSLGVCLRFNADTLQASRLVYIVDVVLWYIRILEVLSVNKYLGPYLKIICKLVSIWNRINITFWFTRLSLKYTIFRLNYF